MRLLEFRYNTIAIISKPFLIPEAYPVGFRVLLCDLFDGVKTVGGENVVGVEKAEPGTVHLVEGTVAGGGDAGIGLVGDFEAGGAAGVVVEDRGAGVFATVVYAEAFPVREGSG